MMKLREELVRDFYHSGMTSSDAEEAATLEFKRYNISNWPGWLLRIAAKG